MDRSVLEPADTLKRPASREWRPRGRPSDTSWPAKLSERIRLLGRALLPSGGDAREIVFASLRRRALRWNIGDDQKARAAYEIDTLRYQDWIGRFDTLSASDRAAIVQD